MKRSEQIGALSAALAAAQGAMAAAAKDSANPFFKSTYADLASVWAACRAPLSSAGLAVVQLPRSTGKVVVVETMLCHASGEWISEELSGQARDDSPQAIGSTITFLRRYALASIAGIAPDDDDGEAGQGRRIGKPIPAAMVRLEAPTPQTAVQPATSTPTAPDREVVAPPPENGPEPVIAADGFVARMRAAVSIRPGMTEIAADIRRAHELGLLSEPERASLLEQYKANTARLIASVQP